MHYRLFAILLLMPVTALAHHPLDGLPMETFSDGLLSGFAHPLLGFDHLFFVIGAGIAAALCQRSASAPLAYITSMLAGCFLVSMSGPLAGGEIAIALSLLVLGGVMLPAQTPGLLPILLLFAGFGLFHGGAFGETLAQQEAGFGGTVLAGYLLGLGVIQYAIAFAAGLICRRWWLQGNDRSTRPRFAGAMLAGAGLLLSLEQLEGLLLPLLVA